MKYLQIMLVLLPLTLCFVGCNTTKEETETQYPVFHFGQSVYVTTGFYKGCKGEVTDYNTIFHPIHYKVTATCPYKKDQTTFVGSIELEESVLVEDAT
jgi:hypothetical protein